MSDWRDKVKVGDVIETRAGTLRVIRQVNRRRGRVQSITLSIRRCSWTTRPYTIYNRHDMKWNGFRPVRKRVRLKTLLDKELLTCITMDAAAKDLPLHCCDVKGLP